MDMGCHQSTHGVSAPAQPSTSTTCVAVCTTINQSKLVPRPVPRERSTAVLHPTSDEIIGRACRRQPHTTQMLHLVLIDWLRANRTNKPVERSTPEL